MSLSSKLDDSRRLHRLETFEVAGGLPDSLWTAYASLANSEGGTIVLGVSESSDGTFVATGLSDPQRTLDELWLGVTDSRRLSACVLAPSSVHTEMFNGENVIVIDVPRAPRRLFPVFTGTDARLGTYRHSENGWYRVCDDEFGSLKRSSVAGSSDADPLVDLSPAALNGASVLAFRDALAAHAPGHPYLAFEGDAFLAATGALFWGPDGLLHPTRAGLLLLGHECEIASVYPNFSLDYQLVLTRRRWDEHYSSSDADGPCNLFEFWRVVRESLSCHLRDILANGSSVPAKDASRLLDGLSEALLNALIHSDYSGEGAVSVTLRPDSFEVSNPGLALPGVSAISAGGVSDSRNPCLSGLFRLIGFGPQAGGFAGLRALAAEYSLVPPELEQKYAPDRLSYRFHLVKPSDGMLDTVRPAATKDEPTHATPGATRSSAARQEEKTEVDLAPAEPSLFDQLNLTPPVQPLPSAQLPAQTAPVAAPFADAANEPPVHHVATAAPQAQQPASEPVRPHNPVREYVAPENIAPTSFTSENSQPFIAGDTDAAVVNLVASRGTIRRTEVEELLGVGPSRAKAILADLVDRGLIAMVGSGRRTGYTLA